MLITADQLVAHAIGDYVIQSDWMANEKTKRSIAAAAHAVSYALPFVALRPSLLALVVICVSHFVIDRWRLARYVVWAKNFFAPPRSEYVHYDETGVSATGVPHFVERTEVQVWWHPWKECSDTGYHKDRPVWMRVWLMIIADNVLHVLCNAVALMYL